MQCLRCGHENEAGANFCSSCGATLGDADETTASLALLEDRQELIEELGPLLDDVPRDLGILVVRRGPNAGSTFGLDAATTSIGRHPDSDLFLDDVTVSRRHALIRRTPGGYTISDVGSLNGTYVRGERIDATELTDMSDVQIGRFVLTFLLGGRAEASA
ncbi:MAG TPA: FHA domain-containing protein [Acidimicrobiia bacterium]|nr:FHA domain-containing protein [Acidimicrobiia bacterium]